MCKRVFIFIDCILLIASFCFCAVKFYGYYSDRASYAKIQEQYQKKSVKTDSKTAPLPIENNMDSGSATLIRASVPAARESVAVDFKGLLLINPETVGWISIENTHINYPVVRHDNNEFYLTNGFERKRNGSGCIFMDYRNMSPDKDVNTILYGHHMKDSSMFRDLVLYKNKNFFSTNGRVVFNSPDKKYEWQVFSVYVAETDDFDYLMTSFKDKKTYAGYIKAIKDRSLFSSEISVSTDDRILTLSTCSYESANARTVVHAKMISAK